MVRSARSNKNLMEFIREALQVEKFGEPFATLLVETFVRMQYVLELSPSELKEDIENFKQSVIRMKFDTLSERTLGQYSPSKYEITFNRDYWQKVAQSYREEDYAVKFFETFSHECLHGMQQVNDLFRKFL